MDPIIENEMAQIAEIINDVNEEIELLPDKDGTLEDIEGAKTLAAELIDKYEAFLKRLKPEEKREVRQKIGGMVEKIKGKLMELKEAPE